jgi:hypothetical protein
MTELIEKTSYEVRKQAIVDTIVHNSSLINRENANRIASLLINSEQYEVELAYKAGMLRFNALDHTFQATGTKLLLQWHKEDLSFMTVGEGALLPSLYLQAKGFKK